MLRALNLFYYLAFNKFVKLKCWTQCRKVVKNPITQDAQKISSNQLFSYFFHENVHLTEKMLICSKNSDCVLEYFSTLCAAINQWYCKLISRNIPYLRLFQMSLSHCAHSNSCCFITQNSWKKIILFYIVVSRLLVFSLEIEKDRLGLKPKLG